MLQLKNITKEYITGGTSLKALKGIDIAFRDSEFVAILGPSGCGKTTLLNIIGGLDQYTSGDLVINGISTKEYKDANWDAYRNHSVGFVFQSYNLIPHQTVLSNVELALTLSGVSKSERRTRAIEALKKVGLGDQINKKPNQMSGGQMQRVAIARALVNNPDILLADEPTGALDSETSVQIMNLLKEIAKDKLVIMVTHNPDLAVSYANRIVKLLDGLITEDSNPYQVEIKKVCSEKKIEKNKSMSFFTALALSFNNLMTKKGRTILTAFAGSIGIIGIALILSVSSGVTNYIDTVEKSTMASYPLTIEQNTADMSSMLSSVLKQESTPAEDGYIESNEMMITIIDSMSNMLKTNNLTKFKEFLESDDCKIAEVSTDIVYNYATNLNTYYSTTDNNGNVLYKKTYTSLNSIMTTIMSKGSVASTGTSDGTIFTQMVGTSEFIHSQYDLVYGNYPTESNQILILVDENNKISDYTLYALGIRDMNEIIQYMIDYEDYEKDPNTYPKPTLPKGTKYTYAELCNYRLKVLLDSDYYKVDNDKLNKRSSEELNELLKNTTNELEVVGIVKASEESQSTNNVGGILYQKELMTAFINEVNDSDVVKLQLANPNRNLIYDRDFTNKYTAIDYPSIFAIVMSNQELLMKVMELNYNIQDVSSMVNFANLYMLQDYNTILKTLGYVDFSNPISINIYPKDFDAKEEITNEIDRYNKKVAEEDEIIYTDLVGLLLSSVTIIVNAISYVLIAFVSISLVVSSIMIGIITYISVLERTKEIGILRAIGASKKDISRVFNAETMTVGFAAGLFGIGLTLILILPINLILHSVTGISYLSASLPVFGAIILIAISVLLTFIAGLIPSRYAARKDPVVALRSE